MMNERYRESRVIPSCVIIVQVFFLDEDAAANAVYTTEKAFCFFLGVSHSMDEYAWAQQSEKERTIKKTHAWKRQLVGYFIVLKEHGRAKTLV